MGRQRVPKGKIIQKKDEKIIKVLRSLQPDNSDDEFVAKFRELYPDDWNNVLKRYDAHERLTPKGKSHPMAKPFQYMLNASRKYRLSYRKGENLDDLLVEIDTPKPKFIEETPSNINELVIALENLNSYEARIDAVNKLGKFKCEQSITALVNVIAQDKVYEVRDTAYQRLVRFGYSVNKPNKEKYTIPDLEFKLGKVASELSPDYSTDKFTKKFKTMYPEEFDLQEYEKKNRFKYWLLEMADKFRTNKMT